MLDLYYRIKWWLEDLRWEDVLVITVMGIVELGLVAVVVASLQGIAFN